MSERSRVGKLLSIVAPMYNEQENVFVFYKKLKVVLNSLNMSWEIICVNDGSRDNTLDLLKMINAYDERLKIVTLSRNFGKENALTAGLDMAFGDIVIPIDSDLQDPPELISKMIEKWEEGFDVVNAVRTSRKGEKIFKKLTAYVFYRTFNRLVRFRMPNDTGDFRLLDAKVVEALRMIKENRRFMKGLFAWVGFNNVNIEYQRDARHAGKTSWNYRRLFGLAIEAITSFTHIPLQFASFIGISTSFVSFFYGFSIIVKTLLYGNPVPGYPSIMVVMLFLGGMQLTALGVMGEYVGRTYDEAKGRPVYILRETIGINFPGRPNILEDQFQGIRLNRQDFLGKAN